MARPNKLKALFLSVLKDKASLVKATLSTNRTATSIHVAVLHATTHSISPLLDHRIITILSLGQGSRSTASTCIVAIMDRLHRSHSAFVALKSLLTVHNIITRGSFILKDQLSFYPSTGGQNFLNLSQFLDKTNIETREFSLWVRWYAGVLESILITSRVLGCYFSSSSSTKADIHRLKENLTSSLNLDLLREIDSLVVMVEEICQAPESLDYQRKELVYDIMRLVSEDYRMTQYHTMIRLAELGERTGDLSSVELDELTNCLKRLEGCKERLIELFVNRKRNDAFWDLISEINGKLVRAKEEREMEFVKRSQLSLRSEFRPSQPLRLFPGPHG